MHASCHPSTSASSLTDDPSSPAVSPVDHDTHVRTSFPDVGPARGLTSGGQPFPAALLLALLLIDLLLRLSVVFRPIEVIDTLTLPDDAYLSLQIARNIARGLGPLYGNAYTNGYQPLYVLLMAPVYRLFTADPIFPIKVALGLSSLFDVMTLFMLCRLATRLTGSSRAALVVATAWIFNGYVQQNTLNGLETGISFFFIVASFHAVFALIDEPECRIPRRFLSLGLLLGLAVLSRIDNLILAMVVGGMLVERLWRQGWRPAKLSGAVGIVGLGMAAVNLPWLAWSYSYTGLLFPISGRAVRFMSLANVQHHPTWRNLYWPMLKKAFITVGYRDGLILDALGLVALVGGALALQVRLGRRSLTAAAPPAALAGPALPSDAPSSGLALPSDAPAASGLPSGAVLRAAAARLAGPVIYGAMMIGAYSFYIFTPWFFDRYLFPLLAPLLMALAVTVELVARGLEQAAASAGEVPAAARGAAATSPASRGGQEARPTPAGDEGPPAPAGDGSAPAPAPGRGLGRMLERRLGLTRPTLVLFAGLVVLLAVGGVSMPRFRMLYAPLSSNSRGGYMGIGLWAREHLPPGTIVGSSQTGALAYFADELQVINLDGVVNEPCYRSLVEGRNMAYIRHEGIQYVLGWQINIEFIKKHSSGWRAGDLRIVQKVEGIRSWAHDWYLYRVR